MAKKKKPKKTQQKNTIAPAQSNVVLDYINEHPNFLPLTILGLLLVVFFHEVVFGGKTLVSSDRLNSLSVSAFINDSLSRGIFPLWCPYLFGGMPSFASLLGAPFVDVINSLFWFVKKVGAVPDIYRIMLNYFLFGLFTYILLMKKTEVRLVALFAALAIVFQPGVIGFAAFGHNSKLGVAVLIPVIFLLVEQLLEKRQMRYFGLLGLAVGIQLLRAHTQMSYYTFMLIGLYLLYWGIVSTVKKQAAAQTLKSISLVVFALVLGVAVSSWLYLPVQEYSQYSIRGGTKGLDYAYATNWSFSPQEIMTFFVPSFMGFGGQTYWGPMLHTECPHYLGIVVIFFAGIGFLLKRDRLMIFLALLGMSSLLVAFGKNLPILYGPLFELLPFFNKFRVPHMILILLEFSMVVLAALGLMALRDIKETALKEKVRKYIYIFGGVCGLITIFVLLGKSTYMGWVSGSTKNLAPLAAQTAYQDTLTDAFKMFFIVAASGVLVVFYLNERMKVNAFGAAIIALLVIDLWWVDFKLVNPQPKVNTDNYFVETDAVKFLKEDPEPFRVFPVVDDKPANWYMYHKIQNIKGYHAAKIKSYQTFLENTGLEARNRFGLPPFLSKYLEVVMEEGKPALQQVPANLVPSERFQMDNAIIDMLNVKYLISYYPIPDERFKPVVKSQPVLFENMKVLPRAYYVNSVRVIEEEMEFYELLKSGNFNPAEEAVLEESPEFEVGPFEQNRVDVTSYDIHEIKLKAEVAEPALMVLSEIYYPAGWKAFVNGEETKIYKTNAILRSIFLEPGSHDIEFVFESNALKTGLWISFTSLFVLLGILVYSWRFQSRPVEAE